MPSYFGLKKDSLSGDQLENIILNLRNGLEELISAYSSMIDGLRITLLSELQVPNFTDPSKENLLEIQKRASNIKGLSGDMRQEAFINYIASFTLEESNMERIISLMVNQPSNRWVDSNIEKARLEIAIASRRFKRDETFAHIDGRKDKRHSLAVVVSQEGVDRKRIGHTDFSDKDRASINKLKKKIENTLEQDNLIESKNYIAAALAELSMEFLDKDNDEEENQNEINKA